MLARASVGRRGSKCQGVVFSVLPAGFLPLRGCPSLHPRFRSKLLLQTLPNSNFKCFVPETFCVLESRFEFENGYDMYGSYLPGLSCLLCSSAAPKTYTTSLVAHGRPRPAQYLGVYVDLLEATKSTITLQGLLRRTRATRETRDEMLWMQDRVLR